jgi:glucose-1-phosphate thymidylyltransferase
MKVVIPTAGFGTRLRPHTWSRPKPLVSVAGKTVLDHVLDMFLNLGEIDEFVYIIGYLGEQIEDYMKAQYPDQRARFFVQEELLGQSHALWLAREALVGPMLMVFVDTILEIDLQQIQFGDQAITWVKQVDNPSRFGITQLNDEGDVERIVEKPTDPIGNLAVAGLYYFPAAEKLMDAIQQQMDRDIQLKGEYFLADAINLLFEGGMRMSIQKVDVWLDCGTPEDVLRTNRYLLEHGNDNSGAVRLLEGSTIVAPVHIHPTAKIQSSVVGPHVTVSENCTIEDSVVEDSVLEAGAMVRHSKLAGSLVGRQAEVHNHEGSVDIGDNARVI